MRHGSTHSGVARAWRGQRPALTAVVVCVLALAAGPSSAASAADQRERNEIKAFVPSKLLAAAQDQPQATFEVIVQGTLGTTSASVADAVTAAALGDAPARRSRRSASGPSAASQRG